MKAIAVIPVFNEESTIKSIVMSLRLQRVSEVIIVNDGSTDGTISQIDGLGCFVVNHEKNKGYGAALISGFNAAKALAADVVVFIDADGQHDPVFTDSLLKELDSDASIDFVVSSRYHPKSLMETTVPQERYLGNKLFCMVFNAITGYQFYDFFSGYYAARVKSLDRLTLHETGYEFPVNLWFECASKSMSRKEVPGKLIYLDLARDFKGVYSTVEELIYSFFSKFNEYANAFLSTKDPAHRQIKSTEVRDIMKRPEFQIFYEKLGRLNRNSFIFNG